jgi:thiopurine S-methyltransferase
MDVSFWHDCWAEGRLGFHQSKFNRYMIQFWPQLGVPSGAQVLVPLCGKSLDMLWLLEQGYRVTGIELSRKAIADFFVDNGLDFVIHETDYGTVYRHGRLELLCADLFESGPSILPYVEAVYDRASLPALPADMRRDYADLMLDCLAPGTVILLQTPEYRQTEMEGPPFSVPPAEVEALYGEGCTIEPLHSEDSLDRHPRFRERGLTGLVDHVHRIRKKRNDD